jgi:hypothetical protein
MTYYDILGVPTTATKAEIKAAYLKLAKEFHPDMSAGVNPAVRKLVEEKFKDVQEAFEILSKHRAEYDNQLRAVAPPPPSPPPERARTPATPNAKPAQPYVAPKPPKVASKWAAWPLVICAYWLFHWALANDTSKLTTNVDTSRPAANVQTQSIAPFRTPAPKSDAQGFCGTGGYPDCKQNVAAAGGPGIGELKSAVPASAASSRNPIEKFGGTVHNNPANLSAEFGIVVQDAGGTLSGCMGVKQPLFGSGPLLGSAKNADVSFVVTSEIGTLTFIGRRDSDKIDGIYKVGPDETGTFALAKVKSGAPVYGPDLQRCPTDLEVHQSKTANSDLTSYLIPNSQKDKHEPSVFIIPPKGRVDVYYADHWKDVNSSCTLPTGIASQIQMTCGSIPGSHPDWKHAPHFTTRLILNAADAKKFNSKAELTLSVSCADELEANGDLICSSHLKDSPKGVGADFSPKPIPKYVALGRFSCYANRRVTLYTNETLGKSIRQLNPGEPVFKVGVMGGSVGLTFSALYNDTAPELWMDADELENLTCTK